MLRSCRMQYTDKMKSIYISSPSSSRGLLESRYEVADGRVDGGGYRFVSLYLAISLSSGLRVVGRCSRWTRTRIACWCYHVAWFFCRSVLIAIRSVLDDHGGGAWFWHIYDPFSLVIVSIKRSLFGGATFRPGTNPGFQAGGGQR